MSGGRIVVIGSGVAGASAAIAARAAASEESGVEVIVVDGGTGASTLAPGALDDEGVRGSRAARLELPFAGFAVGACRLATMAGVVRRAAGRDEALLDLAALAGGGEGCIGVPTAAHHGWDARLLAAQWSDGAPASLAGRFVPLDATLLRFADERDMPDADLARRHDDPARLAWLAERLREALARAGTRVAALLLPPWLGVDSPRARALAEQVGLPVGEALAATLGPSGLRFEAARDRAFGDRGIVVRQARAEAVVAATATAGFVVRLDTGEPIEAAAVVLATGGLVGGGLRYTPSGSDHAFAVPLRARATLELNVAVPATLGLGGRPLLAPGSLFGSSPEQLAWPFERPAPLERAGVLHRASVVEGATRLFVAGEVAADETRTWLTAVRSGTRAGQAAAKAAAFGTFVQNL